MFHGRSEVAPAVATVPAVDVRKISRTARAYCPALTCPPPGVDPPAEVVRAVVTPALFFSAYRFVASWKGLPPPAGAAWACPAPAAPAAIGVRPLSVLGCHGHPQMLEMRVRVGHEVVLADTPDGPENEKDQ